MSRFFRLSHSLIGGIQLEYSELWRDGVLYTFQFGIFFFHLVDNTQYSLLATSNLAVHNTYPCTVILVPYTHTTCGY